MNTNTITQRNKLFEEHAHLAEEYTKKNFRRIRVCGIPQEDVQQEIYVMILNSLDQYDPSCNADINSYLRGKISNMLRTTLSPAQRHGLTGTSRKEPPKVVSLEQRPAFDDTYVNEQIATHWILETVSALPDDQRIAVNQLLYGNRRQCNKESLNKARKQILRRMEELGVSILPERRERMNLVFRGI